MLLQAYEPLLINRVRRVQSAHTDSRELMAAARQGLLKAAARFDLQRVMRGRDRLYALAENYIRNALRDVLTEVRTAARVSNWLHRRYLNCAGHQ
jgi:DNA-directed RNA polymerase specialized sigma subunit